MLNPCIGIERFYIGKDTGWEPDEKAAYNAFMEKYMVAWVWRGSDQKFSSPSYCLH